ncbi:MAG: transporter [Frankiales bacterium]|nr:transporter [Frankiales bacterium]
MSATATALSGNTRTDRTGRRDFRRLMVGLASSQLGDWLYNVALLGLVFERTHSASWLAATTTARILPIVMLGPLGGVLASRYDRRLVMIVSDVVRAALMLGLAAVALTHGPILFAPLIAGLATAAGAPYPSCVAATTTRVVADVDLAAANAMRAVVGPVSVVVGPLLGAVLLAIGSPGLAFGVNAATFLLSALAVAGLPADAGRNATRTARARIIDELYEGAAALCSNRAAARMVGADLVCSMVYGVQTVALLGLATRLGLSAGGYGVLLAAVGGGGVLASLISPRAAAHPNVGATTAIALIAVAASSPLLGLVSGLAATVTVAAVGGAGSMLIEVLTETSLQRTLPEAVYARAYGFAFPASIGGIVVGALVAAPLISRCGLNTTLGGVGVIVALYAGFLLLSPIKLSISNEQDNS